MVLLSEKEVFLRSGRVIRQLLLEEHQLVGVADGIQVLDMLVGDIEHRYELQACPVPGYKCGSVIDLFNAYAQARWQFACDAEQQTCNRSLTEDGPQVRRRFAASIRPGCAILRQQFGEDGEIAPLTGKEKVLEKVRLHLR